MYLDPVMPTVVAIILVMALLAVLAHAVRQPLVVGYIIAGLVIGPSGFALVSDAETLSRLGAIGVAMLLFFVGMAMSPQKLGTNWRIAVLGTVLEIVVSMLLVAPFGYLVGWPLSRTILLGFVIALSSTAVVVTLLEDWGELDTKVGQDLLGILLVQDLAVIPMLIAIGLLDGDRLDGRTLVLQVIGAALLIGLAVTAGWRREFALPLGRWIRGNKEMQVLAALVICFGLSLISGVLQLSTALGAFVAGLVANAARETHWIESSLHGFRVIFVALFFASVGLLIDIKFLLAHWWEVLALVGLVIIVNTVVNAAVLRFLGRTWSESVYAGAMLSQVGEFSFVLAAVGFQVGIIGSFGYQMTMAVLATSLLASPMWIGATKWLLRRFESRAKT